MLLHGDEAELRRLGIPSSSIFPVGQNFQDSFWYGCVWEYQQPLLPATMEAEATFLLEEQSWS